MQIEELEAMSLAELEELQREVKTRIAEIKFANLPRVVIDGDDVRPRYLNGCTGRMGGWASSKRRRFYPDAGTAAADRGPEWRVDAELLKPLS